MNTTAATATITTAVHDAAKAIALDKIAAGMAVEDALQFAAGFIVERMAAEQPQLLVQFAAESHS